jgi:hypothetical protein
MSATVGSGVMGTVRIQGCARVGGAVLAVALTMVVATASARAAGWSVSPPVSVIAATSMPATLSAVSCPSATECVAVGSYLDSSGKPDAGPLVEASNGSGWTVQSTPKVSGGGLMGVSCPSASECVAVGTIDRAGSSAPLAELWNGASWSVLPGASGPGSQGTLEGVSCSSSTSCMAVGAGLMPSGASSDPAELWNGSTWTAEPLPAFSSRGTTLPVASLSGVSCVSSGVCDAVGYHSTYGDQGSEVVTAEWNGGAWSDREEAASIKTNGGLSALSCPAATECEAAGTEVEGWNGSAWSQQNGSLPAGGFLLGDSCASPTACGAVGDQTGNGDTANEIFADTFDGTAWTQAPIQTPRSASLPGLTGISCTAATSCTAVGSDTDAAGVSVPLVLTDNGSGWTPATTPSLSVADRSSSLTAVSCAAPGSCLAVGTDASGVLTLRSLAGHFSQQTAPNPGEGNHASNTMPAPASVACPTSRACLMVGSYTNAAGNDDGFAERWNGTSWSLQPTPMTDSDTSTSLSAISCTSPVKCFAAGTQTVGVGEPMSATTSTLTEQLTGSRWKYQSVQPLTPGDGSGAEDAVDALVGISCSSSRHCTAVGLASEDGGCNRCGTLAERFNGRRWTLQRHAQTDSLQSVACPTVKLCVAVGGAAAQVWNGRAWKLGRIPAAGGGGLTGVSCPTRKLCVAVGTARRGRVLVERWNGSRWSEQAAPDPVGAKQIAVTGVSCPRVSACVLVGSDRTGGQTVSLIETYG